MNRSAARSHRPSGDAGRPTSGELGRERPRGAARREALLEAVLEIVAEVGPDAVTHRRVAEVAELPLASTTYWFDSKDDLLTAALELAAERDTVLLETRIAAFAGSGTDPIEAAVDAMLIPTEERTAGRGSIIAAFTLLLEAARRPGLQAISQRWSDAYVEGVGRLLAAAGSRRPRYDAELLVATLDGLLIEQLASGTEEKLRPRLVHIARALVAAP